MMHQETCEITEGDFLEEIPELIRRPPLSYEELQKMADSFQKGRRNFFKQAVGFGVGLPLIGIKSKENTCTDLKGIRKGNLKSMERLYEMKNCITGVPGGFSHLDQITQGFQPGDLIIVTGCPHMGKTAFCLNIAQYAALHKKYPVLIYSLDVSQKELGFRMLCSEAKISSGMLRRGYLPEKDWSRLENTAILLDKTPIYIDDTQILTISDIRNRARRLKLEKGIKMIIIDYLQLITGRDRIQKSEREIYEISIKLKELAKELELPIIATYQLNGQIIEARPDKRPRLDDVREIERCSDLILFIYRPSVYGEDLPFYDEGNMENMAEILISKNRNGPTGEIALAFYYQYQRFENLII